MNCGRNTAAMAVIRATTSTPPQRSQSTRVRGQGQEMPGLAPPGPDVRRVPEQPLLERLADRVRRPLDRVRLVLVVPVDEVPQIGRRGRLGGRLGPPVLGWPDAHPGQVLD